MRIWRKNENFYFKFIQTEIKKSIFNYFKTKSTFFLKTNLIFVISAHESTRKSVRYSKKLRKKFVLFFLIVLRIFLRFAPCYQHEFEGTILSFVLLAFLTTIIMSRPLNVRYFHHCNWEDRLCVLTIGKCNKIFWTCCRGRAISTISSLQLL